MSCSRSRFFTSAPSALTHPLRFQAGSHSCRLRMRQAAQVNYMPYREGGTKGTAWVLLAGSQGLPSLQAAEGG